VTAIAVVGARGRMGQAVARLAPEHGFEVVCAHDAGDPLARLGASGAKVAIDFSSPAALPAIAAEVARAGIALVSGTTGLGDDGRAALDAASRAVPVVWEPNMSVGVHVLTELVRRAVGLLGPGFDIEIVEAHHRLKADAPSGTALRLAEAARAARGEGRLVNGREGKPGARARDEIGMHAVRGGDVIGDHTVHLLAAGERIELTHRASSRDLFATGALRVAQWIVGRPAGRYAMADVVSSP
jgi:4-hydroxy-tetrahydrodipicolinate reductase